MIEVVTLIQYFYIAFGFFGCVIIIIGFLSLVL